MIFHRSVLGTLFIGVLIPYSAINVINIIVNEVTKIHIFGYGYSVIYYSGIITIDCCLVIPYLNTV